MTEPTVETEPWLALGMEKMAFLRHYMTDAPFHAAIEAWRADRTQLVQLLRDLRERCPIGYEEAAIMLKEVLGEP